MIKKVKEKLNLSIVFIVPSYQTADKMFTIEKISPKHRMEMVKAAVEAEKLPWLKVSDFEFKNKGVSYTYITIDHFRKRYPKDEMYWIMGEDRYRDFDKWEYVDMIREFSQTVIYRRSKDINPIIEKDESVIYVSDEFFDFSSTKILHDIRWDFIPEAVKEYISRNRLYLKTLVFNVLKERRYQHSVAVASHAKRLSNEYKYKKVEDIWNAGLIHDLFKYHDTQYMIDYINEHNEEGWDANEIPEPALHGYMAALWMKYEYKWDDKELFDAIASHTLTKPNTTKADKILYVADKISTDRKGHKVGKLRKLAYLDLHETYKKILKESTKKTEKKGFPLHQFTIEAYRENIDPRFKKTKYEYNLKENNKKTK